MMKACALQMTMTCDECLCFTDDHDCCDEGLCFTDDHDCIVMKACALQMTMTVL